MGQKITTVLVDGLNLTASFFVPMGKEKAIAEMKKDGIGEGKEEGWFEAAFAEMEKAVDKANKKEEKVAAVENKEANKTATEAQRAASNIPPAK